MSSIGETPKNLASALELKKVSWLGDCCLLCECTKGCKIQHISTENLLNFPGRKVWPLDKLWSQDLGLPASKNNPNYSSIVCVTCTLKYTEHYWASLFLENKKLINKFRPSRSQNSTMLEEKSTSLHNSYSSWHLHIHVHLLFSVWSLDLSVASLVFRNGTSCCVTRRNFK